MLWQSRILLNLDRANHSFFLALLPISEKTRKLSSSISVCFADQRNHYGAHIFEVEEMANSHEVQQCGLIRGDHYFGETTADKWQTPVSVFPAGSSFFQWQRQVLHPQLDRYRSERDRVYPVSVFFSPPPFSSFCSFLLLSLPMLRQLILGDSLEQSRARKQDLSGVGHSPGRSTHEKERIEREGFRKESTPFGAAQAV